MKKISRLLNFFVLSLVSLLILSSCGIARMSKLRKSALEDSPKSFVQTRDKQIIEVSNFNKLQVDTDSIIALQRDDAYYRIDDGKELLRLMKGDVNLYYGFNTSIASEFHPQTVQKAPSGTGYPDMVSPAYFSNSRKVSVSRYFDSGLDSKLIELTRNNLGPYVSECLTCKTLLAKYDRVEKQNKVWKYMNWAATAGGLVVGLTSDPADMSDLEAYSFATLFFGSFISGGFRRRAKGYNTWRLEDVIGEYNKYGN